MPRRGGKRPGAGRPKGALGKRTIAAAIAAKRREFTGEKLEARAPHVVAEAVAEKAGQPVPQPKYKDVQAMFDAYEQLETVAKYFLGEAAKEQKKGADAKASVIEKYLVQAAKVLFQMVPYQRSRLSNVTVKLPQIDLNKVTDAQLALLAEIVGADTEQGSDTGRAGETGPTPPAPGTTTH